MIHLATRLLTRYSHVNWALADQTMVSGVNFLTGILLARYLGLEEFGRFSLAWMAVWFAANIQFATVSCPMMSIGPKQTEGEGPAYFGAVLVHALGFGLITFALLWTGVSTVSTVFPDWRIGGLALPLAAAGLSHGLQDFVRRYFFTARRGAHAFAVDAIRYLGQIAVLIWLFVYFRESMDTAKTLWVIALTAAAAAACAAFYVERVEINAATARGVASRHWRFSKWLTASAVLQWSTGNLFKIAAGALLGVGAVGALSAAEALLNITRVLFQGLGNVVPGEAARRYHNEGPRALAAYIRRTGALLLAVTAGVAAVLAAAPEFWLGLAYGAEFAGYGHLVRWYAVIYLFIALDLPLHYGLQTLEHTRPTFTARAVATAFSLALAQPLTSAFGLVGVMAGLLAAHVLMQIVLFHAFVKKIIAIKHDSLVARHELKD